MRRVWSQLERKLEEKQGKEALCPDHLLLSRPGLSPTASVYSAQGPFPVLPRVLVCSSGSIPGRRLWV